MHPMTSSLESFYCMDHAIISKGVPHPLPGFGTFFLSAKRKYRKEKPLGISPDLLNSFSIIILLLKCLAHFGDFRNNSS